MEDCICASESESVAFALKRHHGQMTSCHPLYLT